MRKRKSINGNGFLEKIFPRPHRSHPQEINLTPARNGSIISGMKAKRAESRAGYGQRAGGWCELGRIRAGSRRARSAQEMGRRVASLSCVQEGRAGRAVNQGGTAKERHFVLVDGLGAFIFRAPPHNSAARQAKSFPPSAACKFLDLPPVNLRNLHLHLTKNPFAGRPPHLCGVALDISNTERKSFP